MLYVEMRQMRKHKEVILRAEKANTDTTIRSEKKSEKKMKKTAATN